MADLTFSIVIPCARFDHGLNRLHRSISDQIFQHPIEVITYYDSEAPNRMAAAKKASGRYVLFLDSDVQLHSRSFLNELLRAFEENPEFIAFGGAYVDSRQAGYLDRAYHLLCRAWIEASVKTSHISTGVQECENLLGGCLAVKSENLKQIAATAVPHFWGGEDTWLIRQLAMTGGKIGYLPALDVRHFPKTTIIKWLNRAIRHGYHRSVYDLKTKELKIRRWLRLLSTPYFPALAVHAGFMLAGSAAAKVIRFCKPAARPTTPPAA